MAARLARALILDRDERRLSRIRVLLGETCEVIETKNLQQAYAALATREIDVAVAAYSLGDDGSGVEFLLNLSLFAPRAFRVLYSAFYCPGLAADAVRIGRVHAALDATGDDFPAELYQTITKLLTSRDSSPDRPRAVARGSPPPPWCAVSPVMRNLLADLRCAARSSRPVFMWGEPGTGKHLAASALRRHRARWNARTRALTETANQRLPIVVLRMPPLWERVLDIPGLADHMLSRQHRDAGGRARPFAPDAVAALMRRTWRENVRELEIVVRRADALASATCSPSITADHLPPEATLTLKRCEAAKDEGQRQAILHELRATGSVRAAAKLEGIDRANYCRLMRRLGIVRADSHSRIAG